MSGGLKHFSKEHMQKGNWYMKRCFTSSGKWKSKPQWDITSDLSEWLSPLRQEITGVDENVETREPLCTVGENVNWYSLRKWKPTPVFLPGKSHRRRNLVGYSPWGRKESDTTEWLHSLWKTVWKFLKKKKMRNRTTILPKGPFLGIYLEEIKSVSQRDTCIPMFITLFTITKIWKGFYGNHKN